jgi:hypothetical protein
MIFALMDYFNYRNRWGPYNLCKDPIMRRGFLYSIPTPVISKLKPGDMIFVFTGNSLISWAIMYLTKSRISHVAMYIGNRAICHATTVGVISEPIESLFSKNTVLLPVHIRNISIKKREKMIALARKYIGAPFNWKAIFIKFFRIVTGRDVPYYRFKYLLDLTWILFLLDITPLVLLHKIIFMWILIPYILLIIINRFLWSLVPIPFDKYYVKPTEIYKLLILNGAEIYVNPNGLNAK